MAQHDSRAEYTRRMHRVLEHIDQHLDETLDLPALAAVAHFSAFHFHRLFAAWMGETLGDYLRRRRLEVAAMRLIAQPAAPVLGIALAVGFGSAEAFARAFKARFGRSPTAWRAQQADARARRLGEERAQTSNSNPDQAYRNPDQAPGRRFDHHETSTSFPMESLMKVTVIDRQPAKIAYMHYVGPYGAGVAEFWQRSFAPWMATHGLMGAVRYGISHDDPAITAPEKCRYDACVEVAANFVPSGQVLATTLPGGKYACTPYRGNGGADISARWQSLLRDWLPASGMQLDTRPFFEYYPLDARYDAATGVFECDLCVPVVSL